MFLQGIKTTTVQAIKKLRTKRQKLPDYIQRDNVVKIFGQDTTKYQMSHRLL